MRARSVASAAAAQLNGSRVFGVFPGAPVVSLGMPSSFTCGDSADAILAAARFKARVINLSYRGEACQAEFEAVQIALGTGLPDNRGGVAVRVEDRPRAADERGNDAFFRYAPAPHPCDHPPVAACSRRCLWR